MIVLDACAVLAFLFGDTGAGEVASALDRSAVMSTVNLSEVRGRFARDGHGTAEIRHRLLSTSVEWVPFIAE